MALSKIDVSKMITGVTPLANGGTGGTSIPATNLASGVNSIYKLVEDLQDPEGSEQIIKFIGQKVQTLYPNTLYKMSMQNDPVLSDPATLEQFIRYRIRVLKGSDDTSVVLICSK